MAKRSRNREGPQFDFFPAAPLRFYSRRHHDMRRYLGQKQVPNLASLSDAEPKSSVDEFFRERCHLEASFQETSNVKHLIGMTQVRDIWATSKPHFAKDWGTVLKQPRPSISRCALEVAYTTTTPVRQCRTTYCSITMTRFQLLPNSDPSIQGGTHATDNRCGTAPTPSPLGPSIFHLSGSYLDFLLVRMLSRTPDMGHDELFGLLISTARIGRISPSWAASDSVGEVGSKNWTMHLCSPHGSGMARRAFTKHSQTP